MEINGMPSLLRRSLTVAIYLGFILLMSGLMIQIIRHRQSRRAEVMEMTHDLGVVFPGVVLTHSFNIRNEFDEDLRILSAESSCRCTTAVPSKRLLRPSEVTTISLTYEPKDMVGPLRAETVVAARAGRASKLYRLVLRATSKEVIGFPDYSYTLPLGVFALDDNPKRASFTINRGSHPLRWDALRCQSEDADITASAAPIGDGKWRVEIQLHGQEWLGSLLRHVDFLFYDHGRRTDYILRKPVVARITGPVTATPHTLYLGPMSGGRTLEKVITVQSVDRDAKDAVEVVAAEASDPGFAACTVGQERNRVKILFRTANKSGRLSGHIIVTVKLDETTYRIRIEYLAIVSESAKERSDDVASS
jgi:hypothetical protein